MCHPRSHAERGNEGYSLGFAAANAPQHVPLRSAGASLLSFEFGFVAFHLSGFFFELEFAARPIKLNVIRQIIRTGKRLTANLHLAAGRS